MIECSVFGYVKEIDCLCRHLRLHRRTDRITCESLYSNGVSILLVSEEDDGVYLVSRGPPDRNKNRMSLCSRVQRSRVKTLGMLGEFLSSLGFELVRHSKVTSIVFERGQGNVEISRSTSSGESGSGGHGDEYYLVRAFVKAESASDGERMLSRMVEELEDQVQLMKPLIK